MGNADYTIRKGAIDAIPEGINISVKDLSRYIIQIEEIKKNLAIGGDKQSIIEAMRLCINDMNIEIKNLGMLSTVLRDSLALYYNTEQAITEKGIKQKPGQTWEPMNSNTQPVEEEEESYEEKIKRALALSDDEWEVLKTFLEIVIGCIPVVNCAYDIYSLFMDFQEANEDGEITGWEALSLALGVAALVGDVIQVGQLAKTIGKAVKKADLAKTAAKKTAENAQKAAKTSAKKTAKAAGKNPASKVSKEADKWRKEADKMAKKAEQKAADAAKAKKDIGRAAKDKINEQINKNIDEYGDYKKYVELTADKVADHQIKAEREN